MHSTLLEFYEVMRVRSGMNSFSQCEPKNQFGAGYQHKIHPIPGVVLQTVIGSHA